jgi:LPXTG-motif cell wall-anchored protein
MPWHPAFDNLHDHCILSQRLSTAELGTCQFIMKFAMDATSLIVAGIALAATLLYFKLKKKRDGRGDSLKGFSCSSATC